MKFKINDRVKSGKFIKDGVVVGFTQEMHYVVYDIKRKTTFCVVREAVQSKRYNIFERIIYRLDIRSAICYIERCWNYLTRRMPIVGHDFEPIFKDDYCEVLKCTRCDELDIGWFRQPYYSEDKNEYVTGGE
jgi:hypothetical protein